MAHFVDVTFRDDRLLAAADVSKLLFMELFPFLQKSNFLAFLEVDPVLGRPDPQVCRAAVGAWADQGVVLAEQVYYQLLGFLEFAACRLHYRESVFWYEHSGLMTALLTAFMALESALAVRTNCTGINPYPACVATIAEAIAHFKEAGHSKMYAQEHNAARKRVVALGLEVPEVHGVLKLNRAD